MQKNVWLKCSTCGTMFQHHGRGAYPSQCPSCRENSLLKKAEATGNTIEVDGTVFIEYKRITKTKSGSLKESIFYLPKEEPKPAAAKRK